MNSTVRQEQNKPARNWLISLIINLAILSAVLAVTDVMYETNDDFTISLEIADGYPFVGFVNYFLCRILIAIQRLFPAGNIFMISQMIMSFAAFTVFLKVILDRAQGRITEIILPSAICMFFALDHYSCLQFTKTAALLMAAGLVWLADNYIHERRPAAFACAMLLYYLGVAYRQKPMLPAIAFAAVFIFVWWLQNGREFFRERDLKKEAGIVVILLVLVFVPYGLDKLSDAANSATPELKLAREYQAERVKTTDYPLLRFYDEDEDLAAKYTDAGFSRNDLHLVVHFTLDYDGAASLENLKKINEINRPYLEASKSLKKSLRDAAAGSLRAVIDTTYTGMHIIIAAVLVLLMICVNKPKAWVYAVMTGLLSLCMYAAIYYMQRPQYRALYVVDICAAFWLIYASAISEKRKSAAVRYVSSGVCLIIVAALFAPGLRELDNQMSYNRAQVGTKQAEAYFAANPDRMYVCIETRMDLPLSFMEPLSTPTVPENLTGTGGWETLSPYKLTQLGRYGMTNPVKDLIDSPDALLFGDAKIDRLTEYYNKWYCGENEAIDLVRADEFDGEGIYRIVRRPAD